MNTTGTVFQCFPALIDGHVCPKIVLVPYVFTNVVGNTWMNNGGGSLIYLLFY